MRTEKSRILSEVQQQLAKEFGCMPDDFHKSKNLLTTPVLHPQRRRFSNDDMPFFKMITFGGNAVISAESRLHGWAAENLMNHAGHTLFELQMMEKTDSFLASFGKRITGTFHMFLPYPETTLYPNPCTLKWFEQEEILPLYEGGRFPNALCPCFQPERPDVLAVAAYENEEIAAMAGCSADTPTLWQIGIDVRPGYRGKGLGTYLVSLLKHEILQRGKLPYYGTSLSNYHSWNIALSSGFFPAWVETGTESIALPENR